ncbi:MAG TPA: ATP-binding cassette domain-containing protein [Candidatus Dormibacteraeota bacterium]|nr:ATP-binding cassette domain-containing protein [Candidatus Dormibacteraeota bacterium]
MTIPGTGFQVTVEALVIGVIVGLTYGLFACALTLVYRMSRVLNFAGGSAGALAVAAMGWVFFALHGAWALALLAGLAAAALAGMAVGFLVVGPLARSSRLTAMLATIGAAQLLAVVVLFVPRHGRVPLPFTAQVAVGTLTLREGDLAILAVAPVAVALLAWFLRRHRLGVASRAASENMEAAQHAGIPTRRVALTIWAIAGLLAGLASVLAAATSVAPSAGSASPLAGGVLYYAFAAALIGGFNSLPLTFASGVGIGAVEAVITWNYPAADTADVVILAVLLMVLVFRRRTGGEGRAAVGGSSSLTGPIQPLAPRIAALPGVRLARWGLLAAVVVAMSLVPLAMPVDKVVFLASIAVFAIMGLSLVVVTGFSGQLSLGQVALVAIGAIAGGRFASMGAPAPLAFLGAVLAGGAVALVVALPTLRMRGASLAVPTLGVAVVASGWLFQQAWLTRTGSGGSALTIARPSVLGIDFNDERTYYWLCVAALVLGGMVVHRFHRSRTGRSVEAVRDNEAWAAALAISPTRAKLTAVVVAGMIAAAAGYLYGGFLVNFSQGVFSPDASLALVAMVVFGGVSTVTGAIMGAVWIQSTQFFLAPLLPGLIGTNSTLLFAGFGLLVAVLLFPQGLAGALFRLRDAIVGRFVPAPGDAGAVDAIPLLGVAARRDGTAVAPPLAGAGAPAHLEANDITVRFAGLVALDGVAIRVARGEVLAIIGPNGAGKTTLLDVLSGELRQHQGSVLLGGEEIKRLAPAARARRGIGRSFQQGLLFDSLSIRDTVGLALGRASPPDASQDAGRRTGDLLDTFALSGIADRRTGDLPTGTRRLVQLACLVSLGAGILLLDEPSAGIAKRDVAWLGEALLDVRTRFGTTLVIVDHDVPLVRDIADRAYGLVAGRVVAEGSVEDILADTTFRTAYLGTAA